MDLKEQFKIGWHQDLSSHELPSLDFLNNRELSQRQFRHSLAVIKDCLTTLKLEVFIVTFLRSHLLSDEKCVDGDLAGTVDEAVTALYSIFPSKTRNLSDGNYYSQFMKANFAKKKRTDISRFQFPDHVVSSDNEKDDIKHVESQRKDSRKLGKISPTKENQVDTSSEDLTTNNKSKSLSENKNTAHDSSSLAAATSNRESSISAPSDTGLNQNKVTIFTPVQGEHIALKVSLSPTSSIELSPTHSPTSTTQEIDTRVQASDEESSKSSEFVLHDERGVGQEEELHSSGNELENNSFNSGDQDRLSSDNSGSCSPITQPYNTFASNSDEVLNILPISTRDSFYSVHSSLENTRFDTAEHIYEDIDKYRTPVRDEIDQARHVSQPGSLLKKTYSTGFLKKRESSDDVFVNEELSPVKESNQASNLLPLPVNTSSAHKRSSSDAGISYAIRQNTSKQRQARRERVAFQVNFDQQDLTLADGHPLNIQSPLDQGVDDAHKLHMRKWAVAGLVDSERGYLEALEKLMKPMKAIKASLTTSSPVCSIFEYHKIYNKIEEIHQIHAHFLADIEQRAANWGLKQIIGDIFTAMIDHLNLYQDYVKNSKVSMKTITKCIENSEQFQSIFMQEITLLSTQELITYKDLFLKPLQRIARYVLVIDDLIKFTPEEHPDHEMLQKCMKRIQEFLERYCSGTQGTMVNRKLMKKNKDRKLLKDAFVVELVDGQRKFRHLFLFADIFVSAKLKVTNRSEQFAIKWYCPIQDIKFVPSANSESAPSVPVSSNFEIDNLKAKIAAIKADIRQEQGMSEGYTSKELEKRPARTMSTTSTNSVSSRTTVSSSKKSMERYKRKLAEQEAALWLAMPSLPLTIYRKTGQTHRFLFPTDVARGDWKRVILLQEQNVTIPASGSFFYMSPLEVQGLAETCLEMRTVRSLGSVNLKDDDNVFTGVLYVVVNSGKGFIKPLDFYVVLEVDYYGHYVRKAKTKISKASQDPTWEQVLEEMVWKINQNSMKLIICYCPGFCKYWVLPRHVCIVFLPKQPIGIIRPNHSAGFHIEVEGTQFIKVLCYTKSRMMIGDELCGQGTIKLEKSELGDCHYHDYTVILDKQGCILMSIQYSTTIEGIHHRRSVSSSGVFGVSLEKVVEREQSEIPLVVIACCKEVERRGINELGIYRVSGVSSDVKRLKEKFDENSQEALVYISEADIHAVAGTLKQYFRELPDPLFTVELYPKLIGALAITNEDEKEKQLVELLEQLPKTRKATTLFLIDHLRRVSKHEEDNKMSLGNLATVFGPNLLRPPPVEKSGDSSGSSTSIALEMASGTFNAMSQTSIFYWFLRSKSSKVQLPTTPEITRRLFPAKKDIDFPRLSSQSEDVLI